VRLDVVTQGFNESSRSTIYRLRMKGQGGDEGGTRGGRGEEVEKGVLMH
jgi:hypothetical protein